MKSYKKSEIEKEELKALPGKQKIASIFVELITVRLNSQKKSLFAKHESQNVLFKFLMQVIEVGSNERPSEPTTATTTATTIKYIYLRLLQLHFPSFKSRFKVSGGIIFLIYSA